MSKQRDILNERGTPTRYAVAGDPPATGGVLGVPRAPSLERYLTAVGFVDVVPEPAVATETQRQMLQVWFSEKLATPIRSARPRERVGRVVVVDVTPEFAVDPPMPFCPGINLDGFYGVAREYLNRYPVWNARRGGTSVQPDIDRWLAGIDAAARDAVRAGALEREELAFLLLQFGLWKNVLRGGLFPSDPTAVVPPGGTADVGLMG